MIVSDISTLSHLDIALPVLAGHSVGEAQTNVLGSTRGSSNEIESEAGTTEVPYSIDVHSAQC